MMKKITLLAAFFASVASFAQIAGTSFEEPGIFTVQYVDTGDANVAHDLVNNPNEPFVDYTSTGGELGFNARYEPYDTPSDGLTDGDFVGVTDFAPSSTVGYTDGVQGYQISDADGNFILEFDTVDLTGTTTPGLTLDYALSINGDGTNGNYEGDGTVNESGSDRLRIYVKDLTNSTEIDILDSTGSDLDDFVPTDSGTGNYIVAWQTGTASLLPNTTVQLVIEARMNASGEAFFFDNIQISGLLGTADAQESQFSMYPNPASNFVNIASKIAGAKQVSIFDVLGKQVINTTLTNDRLDISALDSGVYIVKIKQGNASTTKKLVVR
ncbi:T9SS type A sorting domain-containing protein [Altibacter sp.]|uniref:T9SS type A sorting domain-containing protein n=1 Tax=Altibacter sp. TaxID=2024823 RepID=UPI00258D1E36|nr:T9SS type A sorting domain-containing protein [Altibacter sp.]MCW9038811.1 T9SS type A sorting domain-containing protein [Altibacter sp.]